MIFYFNNLSELNGYVNDYKYRLSKLTWQKQLNN